MMFSQIIPPYYNNFDTFDTLGWSHYAISGTDDWQIGVPNKYHIQQAFSSPNVWATTISGLNPANSSNRVLQTPSFDLSTIPSNYALSLIHGGVGLSGVCLLEYSLDGGLSWVALTNSLSPSINWQSNVSGFPCCMGNSIYAYYQSAINLSFLQGNSDVKFRFNYTNGSVIVYTDGWVIDNFAITPEYYNVRALTRDSIRNINKFFTKAPIKYNFEFINQYTQSYNFTNNFYFSTDSIKDSGDVLMASRTYSANQSIAEVFDTIPIPSGLGVGKYYILYDLDATNVLSENVETDNSNYFTLYVDSVYQTNFTDNFDSISNNWNRSVLTDKSRWEKRPPNYFRMEKAHSEPNTFVLHSAAATYTNGTTMLETPYLDLSTKTNQVVAFWYKKNLTTNDFGGSLSLMLPQIKSFKITNPVYPTSITLPLARNKNNWDCFFTRLPLAFDSIVSTKFAVFASINNSDLDRHAIDDFYVGESKPDVSADFGDNTFFSNASSTTDTLVYTIWNAGSELLPPTTTKFYWSTDSLYDNSDVLIATNTEPAVGDTLFVKRKLAITKPTTMVGKYFIIYKLDENNLADEMREYNNTGYLKVRQNNSEALPYFNDFETNTNNWHHQAVLGNDDWVCSVPTKSIMSSAFNVSKGWVTGNSQLMSKNTKTHLYTPIFDFTQLTRPILEYDFILINETQLTLAECSANLDFSIDGGCTWNLLDTTGESFANFYYYTGFDSFSGKDYLGGANFSTIINNTNETVLASPLKYQGRDELNTTHHVIDISRLKNYKKVMFRFKVANVSNNSEGVYIDNFKISNAYSDLTVNHKKNIQGATTDKYVSTFFNINNNGNYISDINLVNFYISNDTILDASDSLLLTKSIDKIRPNTQFYCNIRKQTNLLNSGGKKYLIYKIDPNNIIIESNETNNIGYFKITDGNAMPPIYFNDFNNYTVNGWTFYQSDTLPGGWVNPPYYHHRFRHTRVMSEPSYHFMEPNIDTTKHEWFLESFNDIYCLEHLMSINYIESPTFNFSSDSVYQLTFDFSCLMSLASGSGYSESGNIQYTKDGGLTWEAITTSDDSAATALYSYYNVVTSIGNLPGWKNFRDTTCKINLEFLSGMGDIKFRFAYKGKWNTCEFCFHGFMMDNFRIKSLGYIHVPVDTITDTGIKNNQYLDKSLLNMGNNTYLINNNSNCNLLYSKVIDTQGREVSNQQTFTCLDPKTVLVNLSHLQNGMYFITITENNRVKNYKVIVCN